MKVRHLANQWNHISERMLQSKTIWDLPSMPWQKVIRLAHFL